MAQLIKNYNFGLPLNTPEELDNIERNLFTDDKYASSLVNKLNCYESHMKIHLKKNKTNIFIIHLHELDWISEITEGNDYRQFLQILH